MRRSLSRCVARAGAGVQRRQLRCAFGCWCAVDTGALRVRVRVHCACGFKAAAGVYVCYGCVCTVDTCMGALRVRMFCGVGALWIGAHVLCGCGCGCAVDTCTGALRVRMHYACRSLRPQVRCECECNAAAGLCAAGVGALWICTWVHCVYACFAVWMRCG